MLQRLRIRQPDVLGQPSTGLLRHIRRQCPDQPPERHLRLRSVEQPAQFVRQRAKTRIPGSNVIDRREFDRTINNDRSTKSFHDLKLSTGWKVLSTY